MNYLERCAGSAAFMCAAVAGLYLATPAVPARAGESRYAEVTAGYSLNFPRDYGSHPQFHTEWWYVTGWLQTQGGEPLDRKSVV